MNDDPTDRIQFTIDKFIFRFPRKLLYSPEGLWIKQENDSLRIGMSDFIQQRNGDIAFATVTAQGSELSEGDEIANIETVKVNFSLPAPVRGRILEVNPSLQDSPELINRDPYGEGWLAVLQPENLERDQSALLTAEAYSKLAKQQADAELKS